MRLIGYANDHHFHSVAINISAPEMNFERILKKITHETHNEKITETFYVDHASMWSYWQRKLFLNDGHTSGMNNGYFERQPVYYAISQK